MLIRRREPEDLVKAGEALVRTHEADGYPVEGVADPQAWLTSPNLIRAWVAELNGNIVGHVAISRPDGEEAVALWQRQSGADRASIAVLSRLFIAPEGRGQNGGEYLMAPAVMYANEHGLTLVLDVLEKDAAAIRLYQRLGWRRIGTTFHAYGDGQQAEAACYVAPPKAS